MGIKDFFSLIKSAFTEVEIDQNSGVILQNEDADPRYIKKIRLWNLIEPITVYGLIHLIMWTSWLDMSVWWMWAGFGALLLWSLIFSPIIHYKYEKDVFLTEEQKARGVWFYFFECRGFGSPKRYYFSVDGDPPLLRKHSKEILALIAFLDLVFVCAAIVFDQEITDILTPIIGTNLVLKVLAEIIILVVLNAILVFLAFPVMLRLDNFVDSIKYLIAFIIVALPMIVLINVIFIIFEPFLREALADYPYMSLRGDYALQRLLSFNIIDFGGQWAGYIFWGWLQQLLFLSIFSVQFCRAFDIEKSKKQLFAACLLSASFFGLIHIPNFWLGLFTFISGFFWALYFLQRRNLFSMGVVHGFGGTMFNKLIPINFSVGPSQVVI